MQETTGLDIPETNFVVAGIGERFPVGRKRDRTNLPIVTAIAECMEQLAGSHVPKPDAVGCRPFAPRSRESLAVRGKNEGGNSAMAECMNESKRLCSGGISRRCWYKSEQQSKKAARRDHAAPPGRTGASSSATTSISMA